MIKLTRQLARRGGRRQACPKYRDRHRLDEVSFGERELSLSPWLSGLHNIWQGDRKLTKTARALAEPLQPRQGAIDLPFYRRRDFERELACPDPPRRAIASAGAEADM